MRKIGYIQPRGANALTVYYDDKRWANPYGIYEEYNDIGNHGIVHRKRLINRYEDYESCGYIILEYLRARNDMERAAVLAKWRS